VPSVPSGTNGRRRSSGLAKARATTAWGSALLRAAPNCYNAGQRYRGRGRQSRLPTEELSPMKPEIHPSYVEATVHCACGNEFETLSTKPQIRVEICSNCHPFYTGKQKIVDTEGRVDKFMQRYGKVLKQQAKAAAKK
jgi:large subunit ribosomal protein L31